MLKMKALQTLKMLEKLVKRVAYRWSCLLKSHHSLYWNILVPITNLFEWNTRFFLYYRDKLVLKFAARTYRSGHRWAIYEEYIMYYQLKVPSTINNFNLLPNFCVKCLSFSFLIYHLFHLSFYIRLWGIGTFILKSWETFLNTHS